jgi:hypothetical protein
MPGTPPGKEALPALPAPPVPPYRFTVGIFRLDCTSEAAASAFSPKVALGVRRRSERLSTPSSCPETPLPAWGLPPTVCRPDLSLFGRPPVSSSGCSGESMSLSQPEPPSSVGLSRESESASEVWPESAERLPEGVVSPSPVHFRVTQAWGGG